MVADWASWEGGYHRHKESHRTYKKKYKPIRSENESSILAQTPTHPYTPFGQQPAPFLPLPPRKRGHGFVLTRFGAGSWQFISYTFSSRTRPSVTTEAPKRVHATLAVNIIYVEYCHQSPIVLCIPGGGHRLVTHSQ